MTDRPAPAAHRWPRVAALAASLLVGLPLLLILLVLAALNTAPGQREAESLTASLTGGAVRLTGLHGRIPDAIRLDRLQLVDAAGPWLTISKLQLDWSPLHLLAGDADIHLLFADQVAVLRLPAANPAASKTRSGGFKLPVAVDAGRIRINDLYLAAPIVQAPAHLALSGQAHLRRLTDATAALDLRRTDAPGNYTLVAALSGAAITAHLSVQEPSHGLISTAAHLPDLGAIGLDATLAGPRSAAALRLALAAGQLRATAIGTLDLPGRAADVVVTGNAPPMTLAPGMGWQSIALSARLSGPFAHPAATGTFVAIGIAANGATVASINATVAADTHTVSLIAQASGVQLPAPNQFLLAGGPLALQARLNLDDPTRPVTYAFQQQVLNGQGAATLAPTLHARLSVALPDLEVLARPSGRDVAGNAGFTLSVARAAPGSTRIDLDAALSVIGGANAPASIRGQTTLGATVTLNGSDIDLSRLVLNDTTVHLTATGARRAGRLQADWHVSTADLHALAPALRGNADLTGHLAGTQADFAVTASLTGAVGNATLAPAPLHLALSAQNLPDQPSGQIQATAQLAGAPLTLNVDATRAADRSLIVTIHQAAWKSAVIAGTLALPPHAKLPTGALTVAITRLDDLRPLINQPIAGSLTAALNLPAAGPGTVTVDARNAGLPGRATIAAAHLAATIATPAAVPWIAGQLTATGIRAGAISGALTLAADGPLDALGLKLTTTLQHLAGANAVIAAAATLNTGANTLRLASLTADWQGEHLAVAAPARVTYAPAIAVDRLRLVATTPGAPPATLQLAGRLSPTLDLTVAARSLTPALAAPFIPALNAAGTLQLDARLAGTTAAPTGLIHLVASGLRLRTGAAAGLPPASLDAAATLTGHAADLNARFAAGAATHLALNGVIPLSATGPLDLHADGAADLQMLDPILTAQGRRVLGAATLHARVSGTPAAPAAAGALRVARGSIEDFTQGIFISGIAADIEGEGRTIRIATLSGKAGNGTIAVTGQVGLEGAMPVDLRITAANARPIASDLVTATLDADLAIAGEARTALRATGVITVRRADIQLPDKLPASVAVLDVRRPGDRPPPPHAGPGLQIPLDIALNAPQQIFVRGRGLDAELGGKLHIGGTAAAPQTSGSIALRTGSFSLAGTTLNFTSGDISFNGATRIDPALNLVATSGTPELTATLTVGGYASAPKITLSSVPDRPQDEILAALLFGQSAASLSPFQLAQIAAALAQVSGVGGGGPDPLSRLRNGLGLDRLSLGSSATQNANGTTTNTTSVEAGRYVARGVFVGAKQGVSGSETQAEVQIDLTKGLKLNTTAGNGPGGNTVGLSYQFQY